MRLGYDASALRKRKDALTALRRTRSRGAAAVIVPLQAALVLAAEGGYFLTNAADMQLYGGGWVAIVDERNMTRVCSSCEALTGPRGLDKLGVRSWECRECGVVHDRDVNAARNILKVGVRSRAYPGSPPSVSGNESRRSKSPPSQTSRRCEARTATKTAAA